jgi:uncharacterized membrane protein YedE/YeeE
MDFITVLIIAFVTGTILGFVFQRSQFCMTLILTESFLFRNHRRLMGLVTAIIVSTILFNIIVFFGLNENFNLLQNVGVNPEFFKVPLVLERHVIGGLIFGFGMILAGGCVAGTLFRIGEGQLSSIIAFIGLISGFAGTFLLEKIYPFGNSIPIYPSALLLPIILGVEPIFFIIIIALFFLLIILAFYYRFSIHAIKM